MCIALVLLFLALPVLGSGITILLMDRLASCSLLDSSSSGDPIIFQHLSWYGFYFVLSALAYSDISVFLIVFLLLILMQVIVSKLIVSSSVISNLYLSLSSIYSSVSSLLVYFSFVVTSSFQSSYSIF